MTLELKKLRKEAVASALEKAERYRLLNDPEQAESICRDILDVMPGNQAAIVGLILALSDAFSDAMAASALTEADRLSRGLEDPYQRAYYCGIVAERNARAELRKGHADADAFDSFQQAMAWYEKAESLRPAGTDDPILRWNSCVRSLARHALGPRADAPPDLLE